MERSRLYFLQTDGEITSWPSSHSSGSTTTSVGGSFANFHVQVNSFAGMIHGMNTILWFWLLVWNRVLIKIHSR